MAAHNRGCILLLLVLLIGGTQCQIQNIPGSSKSEFYLDAASDCDGRIREVGQSTVSVFGKTTVPQGQPVTSCSLTLKTENIREPYRFKIQFLEVRIENPDVHFYVYDGEFNGRLQWGFNSNNQKPPNLSFDFTSGQLVTFRLTRGERSFEYDIRVVVTPVRSDVARCTYENEYGCDEYGYNYRLLGTKEIAGIVAGCFALVVVIVIIVVVCCYRKQRGISQRWKEQKLGHVNTAASLHSLGGKQNSSTAAANSSSKPWSTESSRNGFASIRRSPNLPRAKISRSFRNVDANSDLSDSNANVSIPVKRPLPPPSVSYNSRGASSRGTRSRDTRGYRDRDDDRYSDISSDTRGFSEKSFRPPTYREAIRNDQSESSADESTFVRANDDHPQNVFIEREITPTKMKKSVSAGTQRSARDNKKEIKPSPRVARANLPPPEEDMVYDSIEPKKERKALLKKKEPETESEESEEESDTDNESDEEDEETEDEDSEEEESEEESEEEQPKKNEPLYSQPKKSRSKEDKVDTVRPQQPKSAFVAPVSSHQQAPPQFPGGPYPGYFPPGVQHPQPRYPGPTGQYPSGPYPPPGQNPGYPVPQQYPGSAPQPNAYHQANFSVPLQPQGPGMMPQSYGNPQMPPIESKDRNRSHRPANHNDKNTNKGMPNAPHQPPVYSYLVNRGYQPMDPGRHSPLSSSTGASNLSRERNILNDDSDYGANQGDMTYCQPEIGNVHRGDSRGGHHHIED